MRTEEEVREWSRNWKRAVKRARRQAWIMENGPCRACGSTERLEVDHIDPASKEREIDALWLCSEPVRNAELAKCQVLCRKCHEAKNAREGQARMGGPVRCGSYAGYIKGCRCAECCAANTEYHKQRRRRNGVKERVIVNETPVDGVTHGTRAAYERAGCRCPECRAFNAARSKAFRDRRAS